MKPKGKFLDQYTEIDDLLRENTKVLNELKLSLRLPEDQYTLTTSFMEEITYTHHETKDIDIHYPVEANKVFVRGVRIQSVQKLDFQLNFWANTRYNKLVDMVMLDLTSRPAFQIAGTGIYYLPVGGLGIMYADEDNLKRFHLSLQNFSSTTKVAGGAGRVEIFILYGER